MLAKQPLDGGHDALLHDFSLPQLPKHIIAAGVQRVVFVEPYPKSKALQFHDDSIAASGEDSAGKVRFDPFVGIGPRRFFDLFSMQLGSSYPLIRKEDKTGRPKSWSIGPHGLEFKCTLLPTLSLRKRPSRRSESTQHP